MVYINIFTRNVKRNDTRQIIGQTIEFTRYNGTACFLQHKHKAAAQWTVPQLSNMIIYNCTWSIFSNRLGLYCQLTIWPKTYKRKHTSCLWLTLSQDQRKYAACGGAWKCVELFVIKLITRSIWELVSLYNRSIDSNYYATFVNIPLYLKLQL